MNRKNLNFLKSFISRNVYPPEQGFVSKFWPREVKLAKELFSKFPNEEFWSSIVMDYKVRSLGWYKTEKGERDMSLKLRQFTFSPAKKQNEELVIDENKFGEARLVDTKPVFMKDFLR